MEYLQYLEIKKEEIEHTSSFKPYYKWNTFNTKNGKFKTTLTVGKF